MSDGVKSGLNGQCFVSGKVDRVNQYEDKFFTNVLMPAADEFSKPAVVQIRSKRRLGEIGAMVSNIACVIGGYYRKGYTGASKTTGEVIRIQPVELTLDAV